MLGLLDTNGQLAVGDNHLSTLCIETLTEGSAGFTLRERQLALQSCRSSVVGNTCQSIVLVVDEDEGVDDLSAVSMCSNSDVVGVVGRVVVTIETVPADLVLSVRNVNGLADVEGL